MKNIIKIFGVIFFTLLMITGCTSNENDIETNFNNINGIVDKNNENINETINNQDDIFEIKTKDSSSDEVIVLGNIKINKILEKMSQLQFEGSPIELEKIEDNIAYINIKEEKNKNNWKQKYFQGSTGASITTYSLVENLLQRNYKGNWIKGICFTYENRSDIQFDHLDMDFFGTIIQR
ncbi:hypothetical protein [Paraclostridium sordellii]|uniref:hypothetical protein n=1 Tax=Paraclostridium sordellii TaxID=1505 RepID=UPI0005DCB631|nr:hypothetical protein [Paeniclostridium sordellii]CEP44375.1 lipoprotein [[Clostridium] sordellii] [Paeniclostridium sordellii]